jgi:putative ABC transport system permease protein
MSVVMLRVVGVLEPTGLRAGTEGASMMLHDPDQDVYFPLQLAQTAFGDTIIKREAGSMERRTIELSEIYLRAENPGDVETLASVVENVLTNNRPKPDVQVKAPIQLLRNAERVSRLFNIIMVSIAGLSLIVGGIGIMNIMLATVTERTREIGIRRALGAKQKHITLQFLIETTLISLTGGLIGVLLGGAIATLLPVAVRLLSGENFPTRITLWSVAVSFVISGLTGVGFGLYPAVTAAKMNPIEALRHE